MIIDRPDVLFEVDAALRGYLADLEADDAVALDRVFWESEKTIRFGTRETLIGKERIRAFRKGRGKRSALEILDMLITAFGETNATACMLFKPAANPGSLGRWTQHWAKIDGRWRITSAHVSTIEQSTSDGKSGAP